VTVNIHEAKTQLSRLIERSLAGDEVIIAKAGKPLIRLVAVKTEPRRKFGFAKGLVSDTPGWEKPMTQAEADEFLGVRKRL
jgi:prevent-host-death family protein